MELPGLQFGQGLGLSLRFLPEKRETLPRGVFRVAVVSSWLLSCVVKTARLLQQPALSAAAGRWRCQSLASRLRTQVLATGCARLSVLEQRPVQSGAALCPWHCYLPRGSCPARTAALGDCAAPSFPSPSLALGSSIIQLLQVSGSAGKESGLSGTQHRSESLSLVSHRGAGGRSCEPPMSLCSGR